MRNKADKGIRFSAEVLETFLREIYDGFDVSDEIEPTAWREALRLLNEATVEGITRSKADTHDKRFLRNLRHSNEVFTAFKVHSMGVTMAERLYDGKGNLRSFADFKKAVAPIASHQVGSWLRTEYNTAVRRAHLAADWQEFEQNRDIFPNLRWMPTTSPNAEGSHRVYWERKLTLPVNDSFWAKHHPGDRWNCKCSLEATDAPVTEDFSEEDAPAPQRGLDVNPKDGQIFSDKHPYFPEKCSSCPFNKGVKNSLTTFFTNKKKDCYNCRQVSKKIEKMAEIANEKGLTGALAALQTLKGKEFAKKLKEITKMKEFQLIKGEKGIYGVGGENAEDYKPLLACARKAVEKGYDVYLLPNPSRIRTADFIFVRKQIYTMYDLKTVSGQGSVGTRLQESIGQTNRVVLNMATTYNARFLAKDILDYFEANKDAVEVLIFKGNRVISVTRSSITKDFTKSFIKRYNK